VKPFNVSHAVACSSYLQYRDLRLSCMCSTIQQTYSTLQDRTIMRSRLACYYLVDRMGWSWEQSYRQNTPTNGRSNNVSHNQVLLCPTSPPPPPTPPPPPPVRRLSATIKALQLYRAAVCFRLLKNYRVAHMTIVDTLYVILNIQAGYDDYCRHPVCDP
jgi:hypothetical protein